MRADRVPWFVNRCRLDLILGRRTAAELRMLLYDTRLPRPRLPRPRKAWIAQNWRLRLRHQLCGTLLGSLLAALACTGHTQPGAKAPGQQSQSTSPDAAWHADEIGAEPDWAEGTTDEVDAAPQLERRRVNGLNARRAEGDAEHHAPLHAHDEEDDEIADEPDEHEGSARPARNRPPHPLAGVSDAELLRRLREEPKSLGSMSLGLPNGGRLINAVQLPEDPRWVRVDPAHAFGTRETVDYLVRSMGRLFEVFPDTPPIFVGHVSAESGGYLKPHKSHQSGRDVDLGFVYRDGGKWYQRGTQANLDLPRTWALVRALITETDPQFILIDHSIQAWLYDYALSIGEDPEWLKDLFKGTPGVRPAMIRHAKGHATHLHVRFYNPIAEQTAHRSYAGLVKLGRVKPPTHYVTHKVKKGETLIHLAKRYGTTVKAIKSANRLRSNTIMARKEYKIPRRGLTLTSAPAALPERRLPPFDPRPVPSGPRPTSPADPVATLGLGR